MEPSPAISRDGFVRLILIPRAEAEDDTSRLGADLIALRTKFRIVKTKVRT
jgi:hypothetical protein